MKTLLRASLVCLAVFFSGAAPVYAVQAGDSAPPSPPAGLCASYRTCTSISLSWDASKDDSGVKGYQVFRDGRKIVTVARTSYTNTSLVPGHAYTYCIKAYDAAGNVSEGSIPVRVSTVSDLQAPSAPGALSASAAGYTSVALSWEPSSDNTGIKNYEIYRDGTKAATTSKTDYTCKGLSPGGKYVFTVRASDTAGNFSPYGKAVTVATPADRTPPSAPEGLRAASATETEVTLFWNASNDNVKVKGYVVKCDGAKSVKTGKEAYTFKNLVPGKRYTFSVSAYDTSGISSADGKPLTVQTVADTAAPSAPGNLSAKAATATSVSLAWEASSDNVSVQGYYVYCNGIKIATTSRKSCSAKKAKGPGIYIYTVRAYDLAGNLSAGSRAVTVIGT